MYKKLLIIIINLIVVTNFIHAAEEKKERHGSPTRAAIASASQLRRQRQQQRLRAAQTIDTTYHTLKHAIEDVRSCRKPAQSAKAAIQDYARLLKAEHASTQIKVTNTLYQCIHTQMFLNNGRKEALLTLVDEVMRELYSQQQQYELEDAQQPQQSAQQQWVVVGEWSPVIEDYSDQSAHAGAAQDNQLENHADASAQGILHHQQQGVDQQQLPDNVCARFGMRDSEFEELWLTAQMSDAIQGKRDYTYDEKLYIVNMQLYHLIFKNLEFKVFGDEQIDQAMKKLVTKAVENDGIKPDDIVIQQPYLFSKNEQLYADTFVSFPLFKAVIANDVPFIKFLLAHGANAARQFKNDSGKICCLLEYAAQGKVAQLLIAHNRAAVQYVKDSAAELLYKVIASPSYNADLIDLYVSYGASVDWLYNYGHDNLLTILLYNDHLHAGDENTLNKIRALLKAGISIDERRGYGMRPWRTTIENKLINYQGMVQSTRAAFYRQALQLISNEIARRNAQAGVLVARLANNHTNVQATPRQAAQLIPTFNLQQQPGSAFTPYREYIGQRTQER